jgi:hypothetical protein
MAEDTRGSSHRPLPGSTKLGLAVIAFGLIFDLSEHSFVSHANESIVAGFPLGEHAAHLVVIVGMILVLGGVVADGVRISRSRSRRPERSKRHAHR